VRPALGTEAGVTSKQPHSGIKRRTSATWQRRIVVAAAPAVRHVFKERIPGGSFDAADLLDQ